MIRFLRFLVIANSINTTDDFLESCCDKKGRGAIAASTGISESHILNWANMADLMRVSGIGKQFAEILKASGVDTIKELRTRNAENLAARIKEINDEKKLAKATPSLAHVTEWIEKAKTMEPVITH
ncbi:MAG: DUF4332 domain-containing protein [bacterium]|nr:DUF4332 domain-containing protein [bacterium]